MLAAGRVPSALLFAGPEGVGKKTLSMMFAKALNCERRTSRGDDFCGECVRCRKAEEIFVAAREDLARRREMKEAQRRVEGLVYFDLQLIEPITRYTLVEQVRQARTIAYACPFEFPRRVLIFDQAQSIHWQAVDQLLKMLEEPPDSTTLILVCPNAYELRPTIRSRCLRIQFVPVEESVIGEILAQEKRLSKNQKALAARVSSGSVARAKAFDLTDFERRRQPWLNYLECITTRAESPQRAANWKMLFDSTRALAEQRDSFEETLRMGYTLLRDLLLIVADDTNTGVTNLDLGPRLQIWAKRLGVQGIEKLKRALDQAYRLQKRNVNQQLGLEAVAIEWLSEAEPSAK